MKLAIKFIQNCTFQSQYLALVSIFRSNLWYDEYIGLVW